MVASVRFEVHEKVGHIVLSAPPWNYVGTDYLSRLRDAVHQASTSDIRVLLVRSEAEIFSIGGEVTEWPGKNQDWLRTFAAEVNSVYRAIEALPFPTIAAVRGNAGGGGFELALACDIIIATENANLWFPETATGMVPMAGAIQRFASNIGRTRTAWLMMLAKPLTGAEAEKLGIVSHAVADEDLDEYTAELAGRLSSGPTKAYAAIKAMLRAWSAGGIPGADAAMLDTTVHLFETEDVLRGFQDVADALASGAGDAFASGAPLPSFEFEGR